MEKQFQVTQRGLAMIEVALCLVLLLPLALAATAVSTLIHDISVLRSAVEMVIPEHKRPVMTWEPQGVDGALRINDADLRTTIKMVAEHGIATVSSKVIGLKNLSAICCYIVYQVDPGSGALKGERYRVCDAQGSIAGMLSIDGPLRARTETATGIAVTARSANQGYFESIVLMGIVLGGEYNGVASLLSNQVVSSGIVDLPSREVSL
jgi:hypothetical protein